MGRSAAGVKGMDLGKGDAIIRLIRVNSKADLLSVTENGYGKERLCTSTWCKRGWINPPANRGGKGRRDIVADQRMAEWSRFDALKTVMILCQPLPDRRFEISGRNSPNQPY